MNLTDHLKTLEESLLDINVRRDAARLTELLAPNFREIGCSGRTYTRDQIIADLAAETSQIHRTISDYHLVEHSDDWALATYRSTRRNAAGDASAVTLRSSTWILRDSRWQMLFHQGTLHTTRPTP